MKNNKIIFFAAVFSLMIVNLSCKKQFDVPPLKVPNEGARLSIKQLKDRTDGYNSFFRFAEGDTNLYCTVTMDETSGNIYRQVYVRDEEGSAMLLKLSNTGGLFAGDKIRINLNSLYVIAANNMIYIDSVNIEKNVVKISSGNQVLAKTTSISKILSFADSPKHIESLQSQLVELNAVEFEYYSRGKPFANAIGKTAFEYPLTDCAGNQISLRTSGMSNFAAKLTPSGNGKVIAVVQQYNNEMSLVIRHFNEVQLNNVACVTAPPTTITGTTYMKKDFNDNNISSGGWTNAIVTGTTAWTTSNIGTNSHYGRIYNKNGSFYEACESWLISPPVNIYNATEPLLSFRSANSSTNASLILMLSTNYQQGPPSSATWTAVPFAFPSGGFDFLSSGFINLGEFKSSNLRIAFKYSGTNTTGSIWEIDDVVVHEK